MKRSRWGKACVLAASLGFLANGAAWGQYPGVDPSQVVVIREKGKPDRRCVIEQSYPMPDGKTMYFVRDMTTGEAIRVIDARSRKDNNEPIVGTVATSPNDAGTMQALASSPFNSNDSRGATPAGLAGASQPATSGKAMAESESPVWHELKQLKFAKSASDRESAAKTLALSKAHTAHEVVKAIQEAAKSDPADSVRVCCVRCLYHMSSDDPSVVPAIKRLQADPNEQVSKTARKAMEEIGKRDSSQPSR